MKTVAFGGSSFILPPAGNAGFPAPSSSPAQGNKNALAWFWNHAIVKYNNNYYDPSYGGIIHDTPIKWEDASLQSYGVLFEICNSDLNGSITHEGNALWSERNDPKGSLETIFLNQ